MKNMIRFAAIVAATAGLFSCNKVEEPKVVNDHLPESPMTKAMGDKTPIMVCYVETNDVNPLNAGDYVFDEDGTTFFDIVELFASNIHKETVNGQVRPTLYLNDKLTPVLENGGVDTYVRPLQDLGIKVLLTVLGDWQEIGLSNMTNTQADQFATILAYAVEKYGLDGIGFDDEYSGTSETNNTSYTRIITKLHELMPSDKLITVFDWGGTYTIDETQACPCIDYAYHGYFGSYFGTPGLCTTEKWSPVSLNLGYDYSASNVRIMAQNAKNGGYGAMMCFNLRQTSDKDPLYIFQAISDGAYNGAKVVCDDGDRPRDAGSVSTGYTITYDMAIGNE